MNRKNIFRVLALLVIIATILVACNEDESDVKLNPKLSTTQVSSINWNSATVAGFVIATGDGFTEKGICYGTTTGPTTADGKALYYGQSNKALYSVKLTGLTRLTTYYARAYAIGPDETYYGEEMSFKTTAAPPTLANIVAPTLTTTTNNGVTAAITANITDDGGPDATATVSVRGVVWGLTASPTIAGSKTTDGSGSGSFSSLATNLNGATRYYLRAYATNSIGTSYSNEVNFTTPVGYAYCTTNTATDITKTSATLNGSITSNGGGTITDQGFCYGDNANPTIEGNKITVTPSGNSLSYNLTGLGIYTTHHYRAFVTNETGTNYGADVSFTTLPDIVKFWVVGSHNGWDNSDNAPYIESTTTNPEAQGYVNLGDITYGLKLTTDHSWDNPHTFGDDGSNTGKLANPGDNINPPSTGYYLIKASITSMTYSLTKTVWGIIGDATAGGWGAQTNMTYYETQKIFGIGAHLTAANLKFRGTDDWSINYGSSDGVNLEHNGANISIANAGDYAITLDLSHPNAYTYSINSWGVIGDATPDGWTSDQNMTWNSANGVFTITLDLIAGGFKFRANDDWPVNLGGSLSALTQDGANITIETAGNYTITLNPWTKVATVTKN